jgi:hypothetical protein
MKRGNNVVKIKTLFICCFVSLLVGAAGTGGIGYLYLRDAVERGAKAQQLAEDRAKSFKAKYDKLTKELSNRAGESEGITKGLGEVDSGLEGIDKGISNGIGRVERIIDYNKGIERILRSGAVLE